jgi:hypothetical protein
MSRPVIGEPFWPWAGLRVSAGDILADPGTEAWFGLTVLEAAGFTPSTNIIPAGDTFHLRLWVRTAQPAAYTPPADTTVTFHVHDLSGTVAAGSPEVIAAPAMVGPVPTPVGDHGPDGSPDTIRWFTATTAIGFTLGPGVYRITAVAAGTDFFAYHDGTVVLQQ